MSEPEGAQGERGVTRADRPALAPGGLSEERAESESPYISDVPAADALVAWREARAAAGCPGRVEAVRLPVAEAVGRVTAGAVWAARSSPAFDSAAMDGISVAESCARYSASPVPSASGMSRSDCSLRSG